MFEWACLGCTGYCRLLGMDKRIIALEADRRLATIGKHAGLAFRVFAVKDTYCYMETQEGVAFFVRDQGDAM